MGKNSFRSKNEVRDYVWGNIEATFPLPVEGRIPNFRGAKKACGRIRELEKYKKADIVFSAPDSPLKRAREIVMEDKKRLLAVKPKLTGFLLLKDAEDVTIKGMLRYGNEVPKESLHTLNKVDIFLQGCVAVDGKGNRIGKGSGYGDKEYEMIKRAGLLTDSLYVVVASDFQVFDDFSHLMSEHDAKADVILTHTSIIWCKR